MECFPYSDESRTTLLNIWINTDKWKFAAVFCRNNYEKTWEQYLMLCALDSQV